MTRLGAPGSRVVEQLWRQLPATFRAPGQHSPGTGLIADLPAVEELGREARLGDPGAGLDHMLCLKRGDGSLDAFLTWCTTAPGREQASRHPEWRRLGAFLGRLADETPPHTWFDNCWLEFDLARRGPSWEVPSLFVGLGQPLRRSAVHPDDLAGLLHAVGAVRGAPVPEPIRTRLARCWSALPDGAEIFQLGLMLPRDVSLFRLVVRGCDHERLLVYLDAVGWHGPRQRVAALAGKLFRFTDTVSLAVTVGERIHPGLGFECHLGRRTPEVTPRWEDFFQFLIALGLCRPEAWEDLRAWPGVETRATAEDGDGEAEPYAIKGFDHVKGLLRGRASAGGQAVLRRPGEAPPYGGAGAAGPGAVPVLAQAPAGAGAVRAPAAGRRLGTADREPRPPAPAVVRRLPRRRPRDDLPVP